MVKVSIQLELTASEVPFVTELLSTLRLLTDHAKTAPPVVVNTKELLQDILARLTGDSAAQAEKELGALLQEGAYGEPEKVVEDIVEVCTSVALDLERARTVGGTAKYLEFLPKLPEPHKSKVRDKLIQKVLGQLAAKRTVDTQREEFFAHAEAFAALVHLDFITVDGGVQTIERLVSKPATRAAAFTMLGKTVELCAPQLAGAAPGHLAALRTTVGGVKEPQFQYDIQYIASSLGWPTPAPAPAPAPTRAHEHIASGSNSQIPTPTATAPRPSSVASSSSATARAAVAAPPPAAASPAPTAPPPATPAFTQLAPVTHLPPLRGPVYALAFTAAGELVCGGPAHLNVYSQAGELVHQPEVPNNTMVVSMDCHPRHNLLATCAVTDPGNPEGPPCITLYDIAHHFQHRAVLTKPMGTVLTSIRAFGADSDHLVAAESIPDPASDRKHELLCIYDLSRLAASPQLQPVATYNQHAGMVTCVATSTTAPTVFISGSSDCTVRLWDTRAAAPVAHLGAGGLAHNTMVTSVDMTEHVVVSAAGDSIVTIWDLRRAIAGGVGGDASAALTAMQIDSTVLRVALRGGPSPTVMAVSTAQSLSLVDFANLAAPVRIAAAPYPGAPEGPYHDIKWGHPPGVLYTAGNGCRIDLFQAI